MDNTPWTCSRMLEVTWISLVRECRKDNTPINPGSSSPSYGLPAPVQRDTYPTNIEVEEAQLVEEIQERLGFSCTFQVHVRRCPPGQCPPGRYPPTAPTVRLLDQAVTSPGAKPKAPKRGLKPPERLRKHVVEPVPSQIDQIDDLPTDSEAKMEHGRFAVGKSSPYLIIESKGYLKQTKTRTLHAWHICIHSPPKPPQCR